MTIFSVLAEPNRRRILDLLLSEERTAGELVSSVGMAQPTVSQHLKVLREAGLVTVHNDANRRIYRIQPEPLVELDAWLQPYRELWASRLDALERHLDSHPGTPPARRRTPSANTQDHHKGDRT